MSTPKYTVPLPELEKKGYHKLSKEELLLREDAESLLQIGLRVAIESGEDPHILCQYQPSRPWYCFIYQSAVLGHPVALAICLVRGIKITKDYDTALSLIQESASRGHAVALYLHGKCLESDNYEEAVKLYRLSSNQEYAPAQFEMAQHSRSRCLKRQKYLSLLRKSGLQRHPKSYRSLSEYYYHSRCMPSEVKDNTLLAACFERLYISKIQGSDFYKKLLSPNQKAMLNAICDPSHEQSQEALEWLLLQNSDEIEIFLSLHPNRSKVQKAVADLLPMPLAEEIIPHIAAFGK